MPLAIPTELPQIEYGLNEQEFRALVDRVRLLTEGEVQLLAETHLELDDPHGLLLDIDLGDRLPAYEIARRIAPMGLRQAAREVIKNTAAAVVIKDMLDPHAFELLTAAWNRAVTSGAGAANDPTPAAVDEIAGWPPRRRQVRLLRIVDLTLSPKSIASALWKYHEVTYLLGKDHVTGDLVEWEAGHHGGLSERLSAGAEIDMTAYESELLAVNRAAEPQARKRPVPSLGPPPSRGAAPGP